LFQLRRNFNTVHIHPWSMHVTSAHVRHSTAHVANVMQPPSFTYAYLEAGTPTGEAGVRNAKSMVRWTPPSRARPSRLKIRPCGAPTAHIWPVACPHIKAERTTAAHAALNMICHAAIMSLGLVRVVLDEEGLLDRRLRARHVLAEACLRVRLSAGKKLLLRLLVVLLLAAPDLDAG